MGGSLTYNFDPGQIVYCIVDCDTTNQTASGSQNTSGLMISNAQFPGTPEVQTYPATGNILVREGVVQEILSSITLDRQNSDARMTVEVTGGVVVSQGTQAVLEVTVDSTGIVTGVAVVVNRAGSLYVNGTGFTFLLTTTAGGGDGTAEITYDVVGGEITNPTVSVPGTLYVGQAQLTVDVVGGIVTGAAVVNGGVEYTNGTGKQFTLTTTAGGGDGAAIIGYDVVAGAITNLSIIAGGTTYSNGVGQTVTVADTPVGGAVQSTDVPVPTGASGFFGKGYFPDSTKFTAQVDISGGTIIDADLVTGGAQYTDGTGFTFLLTTTATGGDGLAELTYDVVNGEVTNVVVSAPGSGYFPPTAANVAVDPLDVPTPINSFLLTTTAGGGDGAAEISYTVTNGIITTAGITNGGTGYTDGGSIIVTDGPAANLKDHELVYSIRFAQDRQTLLIEALVDGFGVEGASDIFATLDEAIDEYEIRLAS